MTGIYPKHCLFCSLVRAKEYTIVYSNEVHMCVRATTRVHERVCTCTCVCVCVLSESEQLHCIDGI